MRKSRKISPVNGWFALCAACLMTTAVRSAAQDAYFQQEVHYRIEVSLDDRAHLLRGHLNFTYINHSPDELTALYLHLWPNGYQDRNTAFARQQLRQRNTDFYFAEDGDLGYIDSLSFRVDGLAAGYRPYQGHPDIAVLPLPRPLAPGDTIEVASPFRVKIPASFSRLGHVGQSYQISQWYPKPAVYDQDGWRPMPYLDTGEYYSEFGSFEVAITLPENYLVGATGVLQTPAERAFLAERIAATDTLIENGFSDDASFPPSAERRKTIRYTADRVHDFAWFADKRFHVQKSAVVLPSGDTVDTWAFFTNAEAELWAKATDYIDRSVRFFSETVGEYPYPQATAVESALAAGGGMEYPMITVIGPSYNAVNLDEVITHEVGHNWFYGILASDERRHPWLDEGINSYYERRYMHRYYPERDGVLPAIIRRDSRIGFFELAYLFQARRRRDQAPATPSADLSKINYLVSAYVKPALAFEYLEAYLGRQAFDAAMQRYYRTWQFKHPQPDDLQRLLEEEAGESLSWLFSGLLGSNDWQDYRLTRVKTTGDSLRFTVKNNKGVTGPFPVAGRRDGKTVHTEWYPGFRGRRAFTFPQGDYDELVLDPEHQTLEVFRHNNTYRPGALFPRIAPPRLSLIPALEQPERTQLFIYPTPAWNNYDKTMLGALFYNTTLPARRFEFGLLPFYGTASRDLAGLGFVKYHWFPATSLIERITVGVNAQQFHFDRNFTFDYDLKYARLQPYLRLELGRTPTGNYHHALQLRGIWINTERAVFTMDGSAGEPEWIDDWIYELSYTGEQRRALNPFRVFGALEYQRNDNFFIGETAYLKLSLEGQGGFHYAQNRKISCRAFVGAFLFNDSREAGAIAPGAFNLISQGYNDYRYDDLYFGRTENRGIWSQQVSLRDGALKTPIGTGFNLGRSNNFIAAVNLKADLPGAFLGGNLLKPYFDIGYFDNALPTGANDSFRDQILWSGGLMLDVLDGAVGVYLPIFNAQNLADRMAERGNYFTRISFNIDFNRLNPFDLPDRLQF